MLNNRWFIGAVPLILILAYATFALFSQKEEGPNPRQQIHSAIADFGNLTDRGIGQVEILSDSEIRFFITGDQGKTELDRGLEEFCTLFNNHKTLPTTQQPLELSYKHRQIPAISGTYTCKNDS